MFKIIFSCFFFFCFSFGFSNEIRQGTLKNGMCYYLCPEGAEESSGNSEWIPFFNDGDSITFVLKKPTHFTFFPIDKLFKNQNFFESMGSCERPMSSIAQDEMNTYTLQFFWEKNHWENLPSFAQFFRFEDISVQMQQKIRKSYQKNREDIDDFGACLLTHHIYGCDLGGADALMSADIDTMNATLRSLFDPSQMAVIFTGSFNVEELEKNLEHLFGEIPNGPISLTPLTYNPKEPIVIALNSYGFEDDDEQRVFWGIDFEYFYPLDPTFKNHVLNDLLFYMKLELQNGFCGPASVGKLWPVGHFSSSKKITTSQLDEARFMKAKQKLKKAYLNVHTTNKKAQCIQHFLSNISETLESDHQNLLRELELVNFEDLCSFVEKHVVSATEWQEEDLDL